MNNIDQIMELIAWDRSEDDQTRGIAMAQEVGCLKSFFQPIGLGYSKNVWENCAVIVCSRSDKELEPYIPDMLLWLRDLNWPGAELIQERLRKFQDVEWLVKVLDEFIPALGALGEFAWLSFISELLDNQLIRTGINIDTLNMLLKTTSQ